ncbi:SIR2 family protein [Parvularcula sp. LCG005]|uniref:SIR2 family protein n=1 Tax=Parvularcula sp. LCG005 TaxID=3078805 RepID=UPI00294258A9|nr:SIR2 family protein [Parvularcula sp. LCG005]WOI52829.1 hypothetical protein RUI03_11800 [Parvularcula sp. LCG005]
MRKKVIIVGAGASAEFGLPLSEQIFRKLLSEAEKYESARSLRTPKETQEFLQLDLADLVYEIDGVFHGTHAAGIRNLYEKSRNSFSTSIDLFSYINDSDDVSKYAKLFSAREILKGAHTFRVENTEFGSVAKYYPTLRWRRPFIDSRQNWLATLMQNYTHGKSNSSELQSDSLRFITFNYDTIIEDALHNFFIHAPRFCEDMDSALPEVFHVHGSFPKFEGLTGVHSLRKFSESIKFIHETGQQKDDKIDEFLSEADDIYCVGFEFAHENVELLELAKYADKTLALNYSGDLDLQSRMEKLGLSERQMMKGSASSPLGVSKAARQGFFSLGETAIKPKPQVIRVN